MSKRKETNFSMNKNLDVEKEMSGSTKKRKEHSSSLKQREPSSEETTLSKKDLEINEGSTSKKKESSSEGNSLPKKKKSSSEGNSLSKKKTPPSNQEPEESEAMDSKKGLIGRVKEFMRRSTAQIEEIPLEHRQCHLPLRMEVRQKWIVVFEGPNFNSFRPDLVSAIASIDKSNGNVYVPSDKYKGSVPKDAKIKGNVWDEDFGTTLMDRGELHGEPCKADSGDEQDQQWEVDEQGKKKRRKKRSTPRKSVYEKICMSRERDEKEMHRLNQVFLSTRKTAVKIVGWTHCKFLVQTVPRTSEKRLDRDWLRSNQLETPIRRRQPHLNYATLNDKNQLHLIDSLDWNADSSSLFLPMSTLETLSTDSMSSP